MFKRSRMVIISTLSVLMVLTTMLSSAQGPIPTAPSANSDLVTPPWQKDAPDADVSLADLEVPEEVANTVAWRESLTAEQVAAVQAIVTKYQPQLQAIAESIPTPGGQPSSDNAVYLPLIIGDSAQLAQATTATEKPTDDTADPRELLTSAETIAAVRQATADLSALQSQIDQEMAAVLNTDQQARLQTNSATFQKELKDIATLADLEAAPQADSDCFNGAYYGAIAHYYAWYAYIYGYYDYIYYGNSYSYYDYLYNYYGYYYTFIGLPYAGGAYFDSYYGFGYDSNDWGPDEAYSYFNNAAYYSYYGGLNGYYSYYYYGSYYGYYGYAYGYSYANTYAYYAYYYSYYCS